VYLKNRRATTILAQLMLDERFGILEQDENHFFELVALVNGEIFVPIAVKNFK
jgi:hypothetical protein